MAEAIARVIAHEWIHIATQKAGHEKSGVMESQFQVSDLLTETIRFIRAGMWDGRRRDRPVSENRVGAASMRPAERLLDASVLA